MRLPIAAGRSLPSGDASSRPLSQILLPLCVVLILAVPRVAAAQTPMRHGLEATQARDSSAHLFPALLLPASVGAAGGVYVGLKLGERVGWGGGDDPGLISALLFGGLAGGIGSVVLATAFTGVEADVGDVFVAPILGMAAGVVGAVLAGGVLGGGPAVALIGYSLGQGLVTAGVLSSRR